MLLNINADNDILVQIVLVGQPELRRGLDGTGLPLLRKRSPKSVNIVWAVIKVRTVPSASGKAGPEHSKQPLRSAPGEEEGKAAVFDRNMAREIFSNLRRFDLAAIGRRNDYQGRPGDVSIHAIPRIAT